MSYYYKKNIVKEIVTKSCTYYLFGDMINVINIDSNRINISETSHKKILICYIGYMMVKNFRHITINIANNLHFIVHEINSHNKIK